MKIKYRRFSNWTYNGDFLDFIDAGPEAWGCCVTTIILFSSLFLAGYGITKGVKALVKPNNKIKTEIVSNNHITPRDIITYNDVKTL